MLARRNMADIAGVICSVHTQSGNRDGGRRASMPQRTATAAPLLKMERNHPAGLSFASCDARDAIASRLRQSRPHVGHRCQCDGPSPATASWRVIWTFGFLLRAIQLGQLLAQ